VDETTLTAVAPIALFLANRPNRRIARNVGQHRRRGNQLGFARERGRPDTLRLHHDNGLVDTDPIAALGTNEEAVARHEPDDGLG
jgi:hypothetical protein